MSASENESDNFPETQQLLCCSSAQDENKRHLLNVENEVRPVIPKATRIRNLSAFWILGLCNNYSYVIMLSAAFDILHPKSHNKTEQNSSVNETFHCNPISTGAILLADVLPSLGVKLIAPFFISGTHWRVFLAVVLSATSFILTSLSIGQWMSFLGVVCAALSSGLGEITFLAYSSYFEKDSVSTWSSGTGGAGIFGALSYAALTSVMKPKTTLEVMLVVPALLAATFWLLLVHPSKEEVRSVDNSTQDCSELSKPARVITDPVKQFTLMEKLKITKPLLKYMIPLALVYFAEYFINQGLFEIIYFKGIWLDHSKQYRWYQVVYQLGVFISRSSVNFVTISRLWILPIVQFVNATFLFFVAYYAFLPSIWIVLAIILFEGLLGGAAYVNTFYKITQEVPENHKEFSMGVASLGDSFGIVFAGAIAIPVHDALCKALSA